MAEWLPARADLGQVFVVFTVSVADRGERPNRGSR